MVGLLRHPLTVLLVAAAVLAPLHASRQTFSSRIEAVRVDVLATRGGQPLPGLTAADFEILDNGVPQRVDFASFEEVPLNVVMVLDMSASLRGLRLGHLQTAGRTILDRLEPGDRAALVAFSHVILPSVELTSDLSRIRAALDQTQGEGLTSLVDAVHAGMVIGESAEGRSLMIVFSDGVDTSSWLSPNAVLETARRGEVVVYGVEVGEGRASFAGELGDATGGRLFAVESTADLEKAFTRILDEFRLRYLLSYSPTGVEGRGWHKLDVRVRQRGVTVKARAGYFAER